MNLIWNRYRIWTRWRVISDYFLNKLSVFNSEVANILGNRRLQDCHLWFRIDINVDLVWVNFFLVIAAKILRVCGKENRVIEFLYWWFLVTSLLLEIVNKTLILKLIFLKTELLSIGTFFFVILVERLAFGLRCFPLFSTWISALVWSFWVIKLALGWGLRRGGRGDFFLIFSKENIEWIPHLLINNIIYIRCWRLLSANSWSFASQYYYTFLC